MLTKIVWLAVLVLSVNSFAIAENIVSISDEKGDENPMADVSISNEVEPGDLDIVSLTATSKGEATVFEVTFANPVKAADSRVVSTSGMTLKTYAPNGFYTFNLDLYIDTDGIAGAGKTESLPGRNAQLGSQFGWEKVICLTPRPQYARLLLEQEMEQLAVKDLVARNGNVVLNDIQTIRKRIRSEMQQSVYFPTLIAIHGRKVQFSVPDSFFEEKANRDWGYVAGVSISNIVMLINHPGSKGLSNSTPGFSDVLQLQRFMAYDNLPGWRPESAYVDLVLQQK